MNRLDVLPSRSLLDRVDILERHTKSLSHQRPILWMLQKMRTDVANVILCQFRVAVRRASYLDCSSFDVSIESVLSSRAQEQVSSPRQFVSVQDVNPNAVIADAGWVITDMEHLHSFRDWLTSGKFPCYSVRGYASAFPPKSRNSGMDQSIPTSIPRFLLPFPTSLGSFVFSDPLPEPFSKWPRRPIGVCSSNRGTFRGAESSLAPYECCAARKENNSTQFTASLNRVVSGSIERQRNLQRFGVAPPAVHSSAGVL